MAGRIPRDETRILCIAAGLVRSADETPSRTTYSWQPYSEAVSRTSPSECWKQSENDVAAAFPIPWWLSSLHVSGTSLR